MSASQLLRLEEALAEPSSPPFIWLQGSGCSGCTISLLNHAPTTTPQKTGDALNKALVLSYHPSLMTASGASALDQLKRAAGADRYYLVVEGGVPWAFDGKTCCAWRDGEKDVTCKEAVLSLSKKARAVLCVGDCASFGGVSAAPPNLAQVKSVSATIGKRTLNIPGCPAHPDWVIGTISRLLADGEMGIDEYGRPDFLLTGELCRSCARHHRGGGESQGGGECLRRAGCHGSRTPANCSSIGWNNRMSWCADANSPCIGCFNPDFPNSPILSPENDGGFRRFED